jgi:hypothetical protein
MAVDAHCVEDRGLIRRTRDTDQVGTSDAYGQLAARLAHDGDPEPIHIEETDATLAIGWKGHYRIEGAAFIYVDRDSGRVTTTLGYPTHKLIQID